MLNEVEDDELDRAMRDAVSTGHQYGAEAEAHNLFNKEVEGNPYLYFWQTSSYDKENQRWSKLKKPKWSNQLAYDTPVAFAVSLDDIIPLLDDPNEIYNEGWYSSLDDAQINVEQPYNGFSDYDDDAANDRFLEGLHEFLPDEKTK